MSEPRPSNISEPTMALAIPPPASPTGFGRCVKKSQFTELSSVGQEMKENEAERCDDEHSGKRTS